jgi:hypothetical protein
MNCALRLGQFAQLVRCNMPVAQCNADIANNSVKLHVMWAVKKLLHCDISARNKRNARLWIVPARHSSQIFLRPSYLTR